VIVDTLGRLIASGSLAFTIDGVTANVISVVGVDSSKDTNTDTNLLAAAGRVKSAVWVVLLAGAFAALAAVV